MPARDVGERDLAKDQFARRLNAAVVAGYAQAIELQRQRNPPEKRDKYEFKWWAVSLVEAQPFQGRARTSSGLIPPPFTLTMILRTSLRSRSRKNSVGFYTSVAGKKFPRVQLLTIEGLLNDNQRAEHPDYEPDLNFKKAKADAAEEQVPLL